MKPLIIALLFVSLFTQCKKGNSPQPPAKIERITPGYYIVRTKYMCDGRAFVLGSISNYEAINWQPFTPGEIKGIKEDAPFVSNSYIWRVGESVRNGIAAELPGPYSGPGVIHVFSMFQQAPDQSIRYIVPPGPANYPGDNTGLGIGPSYRVDQSAFSDADLENMQIAMTYIPVSDSTGRLAGFGKPHWWYLSLPTDPDDVCDNYNPMVIWRNSWVCPNSTTIGNAWRSDACAISQLVLEKVN